MSDLFENKNIAPMLIRDEVEPFDDPDWIFELKLDGIRSVAYLDKSTNEMKNKRNMRLSPFLPELNGMNKQVRQRCVLDGELFVMKDGAPDFEEMQKRAIMTNPVKIKLSAERLPVSFVAYDILYYKDKEVMSLPLLERKKLLDKVVKENERIAVSRYIEKEGTALFALTQEQKLEGVVGKRKTSLYYPGKETKDWVKIKNMLDDDFVVCGYIYKEGHMVSVVLGQYDEEKLVYKGHVTFGVRGDNFKQIKAIEEIPQPPFDEPIPSGNEEAHWLKPVLVCTVKFMEYTNTGSMRQPVLKGLRNDKLPLQCKVKI